MLSRIERRLRVNFDWPIFLAMIGLAFFGLSVLYSAGFDGEEQWSPPMHRQAAAMLSGVIAYLIAMLVNPIVWRRWGVVVYAVSLGGLAAVAIGGVVAGGARRWLDIGLVRVQPSELMKVGVILVLARLLSRESAPPNGYGVTHLILPCFATFLPMAVILRQPDLGTALCILLIGGSMVLLAGVRGRTLGLVVLLAIALAIPGWTFLAEYQRKRVISFLSPETDPLGSGYHAIQSMIAVGSGELVGKGILQGTQTQLRFLPEQTTDFLFSVLAEEWGFVGSALIVILYGYLVLRLIQISLRCTERFPAFLCFGVASLIFWQAFINIGMVTGMLPVVGITLPLLSYGGSSVVTVMIALGLAAGVSCRRFRFS